MRWISIRFSIRHLLIACLAVGAVLAFISPIVHRSRSITKTEHDAIARISKSEWCLINAHEHGLPEGTVFVLSIHVRCPDPDAELQLLAPQLNKLRRVDVYAAGTQLTDDGLLALHTVTSLNELMVDDTQVTNDGIQRLKRQSNDCTIVHTTRSWYPPE